MPSPSTTTTMSAMAAAISTAAAPSGLAEDVGPGVGIRIFALEAAGGTADLGHGSIASGRPHPDPDQMLGNSNGFPGIRCGGVGPDLSGAFRVVEKGRTTDQNGKCLIP